MNAPSYRWSCLACGAANEPGVAVCCACGLPASATGKQITATKARLASPTPAPPAPTKQDHWLLGSDSFILFFPEGIAAALILLASPGWLLSLLIHGHLAAAGILALGAPSAGAAAYFAMRKRSRALLYVSVVVLVVVAYWANALS